MVLATEPCSQCTTETREPMARPGDSGRGLLGVDEKCLGGGGVDLDEDALARAHLGGVDHGPDMPVRHQGQAAGSSRVVARATGLGDVGDAILELDENVVAVIDTDAVAGTEVLVYPHSHDCE